MKSIISILLISCLTLPVVGTYSLWEYERHLVRKSVKRKLMEGVESSELVLLKFSKEEITTKLRWEHSREFEYNEQMYDIVETVFEGDSVFYRCWWDHAETALNIKLDKLIAEAWGNAPIKKDSESRLLNLLKLPYLVVNSYHWSKPKYSLMSKAQSLFLTSKQEDLYFSVLSPPPETV